MSELFLGDWAAGEQLREDDVQAGPPWTPGAAISVRIMTFLGF